MINEKKFQSDINGLRGWSVLLVVLFHFNIQIFKGGFIGVDVFFVISGFLMTKIIIAGLDGSSFNYFEFLFKRIKRIFPALFAMMLIIGALGYFFLPPNDLNALAMQIQQAALFNSNNYYSSQQGYFSADIDNRWLLHTWSLAVEWQFYMLYPALVWSAYGFSKKISDARSFFFTVMGLAFLVSLTHCISAPPQFAFFSVFSRAWQMIAGGLVYLVIQYRVSPVKYSASMSYGGLVIAGFSVFAAKYLSLESVWPGYYAILPVFGVCLILLASYEENFLLNNFIIRNLGAWSYSIYLWHWPIVIAFTISGFIYDFPKLSKVTGIIVSVILGCLSFRWFETARYLKVSTGRSVGSVIAISAVVLITTSVYVSEGGALLGRANQPQMYKDLELLSASHTYRESCENHDNRNKNFCYVNRGASGRKILIVGDSHAGHLFPWFTKNSKVNTTFFIKSGCPFIEGFERVGVDHGCRIFFKKAFDLIKSGGYDTVIISQNWSWFSKNANDICSYDDGRCIPLRSSRNPMLSLEKTRSTLSDFLNNNINVVVLDATPYYHFNVPNRIARDFFWHGKEKKLYNVDYFFSENQDWDDLFEKLSSNTRFHVVSLRPKLCTENNCAIFDELNGISVYKDTSHLNPVWIEKNADVFLPYVSLHKKSS
jgi:peptidoglycan/LPS O-acetylase OafA/YrhL